MKDGPNNIEIDNIEDPLPFFDLTADVIVIEDRDYAVWYSDMNDEEAKYYGKRLSSSEVEACLVEV